MNTTYRLLILLLFTLTMIIAAVFMSPLPQNPAYHLFADHCTMLTVPNALNVLSNLPFVIIGIYGLSVLSKTAVTRAVTLIYGCLFAGILLTGIGSAYYHLHPDNQTLVYDRLPMTIVFMSFLSAAVYEYINEKGGYLLLLPLLIIGITSVFWWQHTESIGRGDLRPYLLVQFYPVFAIPIIIFLFPSTNRKAVLKVFLLIVLWYVVAKVLETFDKQIYNATSVVSGHTLKHLAAATSTYYIVRVFVLKYRKVASLT